MIPERLKAISVSSDTPILSALDAMSNAVHVGAPTGMVLVIDSDDRLIGVATDGDVRRGLLRQVALDVPVEEIMVRDPVTLPSALTPAEIVERIRDEAGRRTRLRERKVDKIILVGDDGRVTDVVSFYDLWYLTQARAGSVAVVGLGFVGLTLAVALADVGLKVIGVEYQREVVDTLRAGRAHFHEKGLDSLIRHHVDSGQLSLATDLESVDADVFIIAVGTPIDEAGEPRLDDVRTAAHAVGKRLRRRGLVMLRSTVPVGTCRGIVAPILEEESGLTLGRDAFLSFAPERTVEGKALEELRSLPQVIGGWDRASVQVTADFFRELTPTIVEVESLESAEMIKLVNNSYRDLSFAFSNQLALICDHWNIDAAQLVKSANEGYPRDRVPVPSPGVGGICLTKDPHIYAAVAREAGISDPLSRAGRSVNEQMPGYVAERILGFLHDHGIALGDAKVLLAGFAFKGQPETSDVRFSTTLEIMSRLKESGINVWGFDPVVSQDVIESLGARWCDVQEGFGDAHAVAILNNHPYYSTLDVIELVGQMKRPSLFFDAWRLFPMEEILRVDGAHYGSLGFLRPPQARHDDESART